MTPKNEKLAKLITQDAELVRDHILQLPDSISRTYALTSLQLAIQSAILACIADEKSDEEI